MKLRALPVLLFLSLAGCSALDKVTRADNSESNQVAEAAQSVGDHAEAARLYERAAERNPDSSDSLVGLGRSYIALNQFSRAENALTRARDLDRKNPEILNQLGTLALHRGDAEAGLSQFDEALRQDRRNLGALTGKGVALDYLSRHNEAQEVYNQGLAIYPTNFVLLNNKSLSQVLSGDTKSGFALMEELRSDPNLGDSVRANLAIAHALEGRPKEARSALNGMLTSSEIERLMRSYGEARKAKLQGKPIGHLIFR